MDEMYCFPEDALADSELNQSRHRATTFDLIRANGNIAGYNLTGMLDHALTGEGPWTFWRRWKPSAMETTAAGWSPLRWCLDLAPAVSFAGGEVELDLALANEDVLPAGRYPAGVALVGPGGWRWEQSVEVAIDGGRGPLAVPVLAERVELDGLPGRYRGAASLGTVAAPAAGRAAIDVIGRPAPLAPPRRRRLGFGDAELRLAGGHGLDIVPGRGAPLTAPCSLSGTRASSTVTTGRAVAAVVDRGLRQ